MAPGSVIRSVSDLSDRYRPEVANGLKARFRLKIGSLLRDVIVDGDRCEVVAAEGDVDVEICTAPAVWLDMHSGHLSGIEAFAERRLVMRGSIQKALLFEPLFERPDAGGLRYEVRTAEALDTKMSFLVAGDAGLPPLLMLHGLGATKASLLTLVPEMARHYRVYVPDLPGFGTSTKPRGRYNAPWFAERMFAFMDSLEIDRASLIGNSMGGRISQEMALVSPERVAAMALLCPATAFAYRPALSLVKLLRPELGIAVGLLPRKRIQEGMKALFHNPKSLEGEWYDAATDDFLKTWRSPRARMAFFASLRNIYLDEPYGETGLFTRLARMETPALYIYGRRDVLITPHYAKKIGRTVPGAKVELWNDCGHVPQIEHPQRTIDTILRFFAGSAKRAAAAV